MKKEWENRISELVGVNPILIDSALFSAQKRQRLYWTNIPVSVEVQDRGIMLSDIYTGEDRPAINDNPVVIRKEGGVFWIKNATKQGYAIAKEGCSVNLEMPNSKTRRGRVSEGKTNTLNTACNYGYIHNGNLVELNITEYERLQTLPDNYTQGVPVSQRKKVIGNGWTVDVISYIFSYLPKK
jgi:site-specific DNA-cytosine methylase